MYRPLLTKRICKLIHGLGLYSAFLLWYQEELGVQYLA